MLSDEDVKNFVTNHDKKDQDQANLYVLMCYQGNGGTVGIAWVGTVCGSDVTYRISMNAWFGSDQMSGEVWKWIALYLNSSSTMLFYL